MMNVILTVNWAAYMTVRPIPSMVPLTNFCLEAYKLPRGGPGGGLKGLQPPSPPPLWEVPNLSDSSCLSLFHHQNNNRFLFCNPPPPLEKILDPPLRPRASLPTTTIRRHRNIHHQLPSYSSKSSTETVPKTWYKYNNEYWNNMRQGWI